jgi:hypothetical protein
MTNPIVATERIFKQYDPENDAAPVSLSEYNLAVAVRYLSEKVEQLEKAFSLQGALNHLEHAQALASEAQSTDDAEMETIYVRLASTHAAVAQAEALTRIADALETISKTVVSYNGMSYLSTMDRRI